VYEAVKEAINQPCSELLSLLSDEDEDDVADEESAEDLEQRVREEAERKDAEEQRDGHEAERAAAKEKERQEAECAAAERAMRLDLNYITALERKDPPSYPRGFNDHWWRWGGD